MADLIVTYRRKPPSALQFYFRLNRAEALAVWLLAAGLDEAYFDDNGTHAQASVAVAACFISTDDKWNTLERLWNELNLKERFGIFHMADFVARTKQFKNWDDAKRDRVIRELIKIIKTNVDVSVMGAVIKADYDSLDDVKTAIRVLPAPAESVAVNEHRLSEFLSAKASLM